MNETSKSHYARLRNGDYAFLRGDVLDVGSGLDPLKLPPPSNVTPWDWEDGDAQYLKGVKDESFDVVYSSHCLEHCLDVEITLSNWARVCKEGGYVYALTPDWLWYERYQWPSKYNEDHKHSFTLTDQGVETDRKIYNYREMVKVGKAVGLTLVDCRTELDNYDFRHTFNMALDQTQANALAQVCWIYLKA